MEDTKERLTQIIEFYNIGKKPLSRLLGWGETTVINQLKGSTPNREFAEKINEIWESPYAFSEILEKNREMITEVAYKKAKKAVEKRLFKDKAAHVVLYLANTAGCDIAPYQIVATLFYAQAANLILHGAPLIDEDIVYKPKSIMPYPGIYARVLKNGLQVGKPAVDSLTDEDKNLVSAIHKLLNGYSPNAVKALLKDDRTKLIDRHKTDPGDTEIQDGLLISLYEFQDYCREENITAKISDVKGFRKYFDEKLKKSGKKKES